jgi:hypothetical protein
MVHQNPTMKASLKSSFKRDTQYKTVQVHERYTNEKASQIIDFARQLFMEAAGIEPASENVP